MIDTKAGRLAVAGAVAPRVRESREQNKQRRVARIGPDGEVVGFVDLATVQAKILERSEIELSFFDEKKKSVTAHCERCGVLFQVRTSHNGAGGTRSPRCSKCQFLSCKDCGKRFPRNYASPAHVKKHGVPTRCRPCRVAAREKEDTCTQCGAIENTSTAYGYRLRHQGEPMVCAACRNPKGVRAASHGVRAKLKGTGKPKGHSASKRRMSKAMTNNVTPKKGA